MSAMPNTRTFLNRLIATLQFLTILPVGRHTIYEPMGMIPLFPLAGLLIGTLLSIFDQVARLIWPAPVAALLDVLLLALITGGLHLDGLGDAADGLLGHHTRERALAIMKDSRVGAMGLIAVFFGLTLKWGGLYGIGPRRALILITVPALARSGMLLAIRLLPYGRPGGGTGRDLFSAPLPWRAFLWMLLPMALCLAMGWRGLWLLIAFAASSATVLAFYRRRLGCVTGDMLGAMVETLEAVLFLLLAMGIR